MNNVQLAKAFRNGEKFVLIPVKRLPDLKKEIAETREKTKFNDFQNWIADELYSFDPPLCNFTVVSVLLAAIPHPFFSDVTLHYEGAAYHCKGLVMSDFAGTRKAIETLAERNGFHVLEADKLPLKRLAVHSGLACYGRNNITYIEGMGSNFSYVAYFSDISADDGDWLPLRNAPQCGHCRACLASCPTAAIAQHRFLIDNERCLSFLNESAEPFPVWLPLSVHHTIYDCLICQSVCPMNKDEILKKGDPVIFDEAETAALLAGCAYESYPPEMKKKAAYLGLFQWPDGIAKNIRKLIEAQQSELQHC